MAAPHPVRWFLLSSLASIAVAVAWASIAYREGPMAVVLPLGPTTLAAAGVALAIGVVGWLAMRRPFARLYAAALALAAAAAVATWAAHDPLRFATRSVAAQSGDIALSGTMFLPRGEVVAGAVLVHGSGCETRKEYAFYARDLARHGIAAVAYDKRGCGESTGSLYDATYADYAKDAVTMARRLGEITGERPLAYVGFSEAEWVIPQALAEGGDLAVLVGPSGMTPAEQVREEVDIRLRRAGYDEADREAAAALMERLQSWERTGDEAEALAAALAAHRDEAWFSAAEDLPRDVPEARSTWWSRVMDTDPATLWRGVHAHVLAVKGTADDRSRSEIARRRLSSVIPSCVWAGFDGADHSVLLWPRGDHRPPPRFPDGYPAIIARWIRSQAGQPAGEPPRALEPCLPAASTSPVDTDR